MMRRALLGLSVLALGSAAMAKMAWPDLLTRPHPKYDARVSYGADPLQHVDVWLPKGGGLRPVVLMIHGGCWQSSIATADIMDWIADDLRTRGYAVWNIDYRGVDRTGGGYPGTFLDVAAASDALVAHAREYQLDTRRIVAIGHSAGGHLALWTAARGALPTTSPLITPNPIRLRGAISIGGLPDLEAAATPPGDTCGADAVPRLVGMPGPERPDVYADTSPARLLPPTIPIALINGAVDRIAPPAFAEAYTKRMAAAGKAIGAQVIPNEGHVELIAPETRAWAATVARLGQMLARP